MFRSKLAGKSRHRAAIVAGALAGVITPLAAHASLTIQMSLSPTVAGIATTPTRAYVDPTTTDVPVYVYATVTGSVATDFQGVQYLYYNLNNTLTTAGTAGAGPSTINAATTTTATAFTGAFATGGPPNNVSSQLGAITNVAGGVSAGDTTSNTLTNMVKPMVTSNAPTFGAAGASATFLVETLHVAPGAFQPSTQTGLNATRFNVSIPSAATFAANYGGAYALANWNEDSNVNTGNGSASSIKHVQGTDPANGSYVTSGVGVAVIDTLQGDTDDNGIVNILDFNNLTGDFNKPGTWAQGDSTGTSSVPDGFVNILDFNALTGNFNKSLAGLTPNEQALALAPLALFAAEHDDTAAFNAIVGVPEPTSLALLAVGAAGLMGRRRRKE